MNLSDYKAREEFLIGMVVHLDAARTSMVRAFAAADKPHGDHPEEQRLFVELNAALTNLRMATCRVESMVRDHKAQTVELTAEEAAAKIKEDAEYAERAAKWKCHVCQVKDCPWRLGPYTMQWGVDR